MSSGFGTPRVRVDGKMIEYEEVILSEEHGTVWFKEGNEVRRKLKWGQKIEFIRSLRCTCIDEHDNIFVVKKGRLATVWQLQPKASTTKPSSSHFS